MRLKQEISDQIMQSLLGILESEIIAIGKIVDHFQQENLSIIENEIMSKITLAAIWRRVKLQYSNNGDLD